MKTTLNAQAQAKILTGQITNARKLNVVSRNPALATGTLPMLFGELPKTLWSEGAGIPIYMGHGVLRGEEQFLLSFRLQVGPTMVYWLADPHDSEIVALLRTWAAANQMATALQSKGGVFILGRNYPAIPLLVQKICDANSENTERFVRSANGIVASGLLQSNATSDIPSISKLKNVHAFLVLSAKANAAITGRAH
jgi:hypothetical protein